MIEKNVLHIRRLHPMLFNRQFLDQAAVKTSDLYLSRRVHTVQYYSHNFCKNDNDGSFQLPLSIMGACCLPPRGAPGNQCGQKTVSVTTTTCLPFSVSGSRQKYSDRCFYLVNNSLVSPGSKIGCYRNSACCILSRASQATNTIIHYKSKAVKLHLIFEGVRIKCTMQTQETYLTEFHTFICRNLESKLCQELLFLQLHFSVHYWNFLSNFSSQNLSLNKYLQMQSITMIWPLSQNANSQLAPVEIDQFNERKLSFDRKHILPLRHHFLWEFYHAFEPGEEHTFIDSILSIRHEESTENKSKKLSEMCPEYGVKSISINSLRVIEKGSIVCKLETNIYPL